MEEFENINTNNEEESTQSQPSDGIADAENTAADEVTAESVASESAADISPEAAEAELAVNTEELPISAEPSDSLPEQSTSERPLYRWNYEEQSAFIGMETKKKRKNGAVIYAVVMTCVFSVAFLLLSALLVINTLNSDAPPTGEPSAPSAENTSERIVYVREHDPESGVLTTQEIYNKCLPAVVTVSVSNDSGSGVGSGFIISEDGYIVTANHVVEDMTSVWVILSDGRQYSATVVDGNALTDLALLKVSAKGLPTIAVGDSSKLLVGDHVVAIGTPASLDFAGSLSDGTVSYNNRLFKIYDDNGSVEKKMILIQTNALVNPGNSGCPLINEYGEVVGIVTMKLNSSYYEGMCFAIPSHTAMPIINAMKNDENYDSLLSAISKYPAKLGISGENAVTSSNVSGVKITSFTSNEYDVYRQMKVGDIITRVDNIEISSISYLVSVLDRYEPGDTIEITFFRNTQMLTVKVVLGK